MKHFVLPLLLFTASFQSNAQYWQQAADYTMEVSLDTETANYSGVQHSLWCTPTTLLRHFTRCFIICISTPSEPGSEMAVRLKSSPDRNGPVLK